MPTLYCENRTEFPTWRLEHDGRNLIYFPNINRRQWRTAYPVLAIRKQFDYNNAATNRLTEELTKKIRNRIEERMRVDEIDILSVNNVQILCDCFQFGIRHPVNPREAFSTYPGIKEFIYLKVQTVDRPTTPVQEPDGIRHDPPLDEIVDAILYSVRNIQEIP